MAQGSDPILQRYAAAKARNERMKGLISEAYRYTFPEYDPYGGTFENPGAASRGEIYDPTAGTAVAENTAELHGQMFPFHTPWQEFAPAGDFTDEQIDKTVAPAYEAAAKKFHAGIWTSNFHSEISPSLNVAHISTGCIMAQHRRRPDGTIDPANPLQFTALSPGPLVMEEGAGGLIDTVFRQWKKPARMVPQLWPAAKLPAELKTLISETPEAEVRLLDGCLPNEAGGWDYVVYYQANESAPAEGSQIFKEPRNRSLFIAFRMDKAPGEDLGRGPVITTLPDIKTLNKVAELLLKNGSIDVTGIWQADDDGVMNPSAVVLEPGAIIPKAVGSKGLQRLESAANFNLSQFILTDMQQKVSRAIRGPQLPPPDRARRTAFEIDVRDRDQAAVRLPLTLRLIAELSDQLALTVYELLSDPRLAGSPFYIPPLTVGEVQVQPLPVSPLVRLQDQAEVYQQIEGAAMLEQVFPGQVMKRIDLPKVVEKALLAIGFKESQLLTPEQVAENEARDKQAAVAEGAVAGAVEAVPKVIEMSAAGRGGARGGGGQR